MDESKAGTSLLSSLADARRSKTGRLRELLPEIEHARELGISHAQILERLNERGLELNYKTYTELLYRIRAQAKAQEPTEARLHRPQAADVEPASPAIESPGTVKTPQAASAGEMLPALASEPDTPMDSAFQADVNDPYGVIPDKEAIRTKFERYGFHNSLLKRMNKAKS